MPDTGVQSQVDDFELIEMVNLPEKDTGIPGITYISTMQGSHGPRVKWFPGQPGREAPSLTVTVADPPAIINNGLAPRDAGTGARRVTSWVEINAPALLDFWWNGHVWTRDEVNAFVDKLKKLP